MDDRGRAATGSEFSAVSEPPSAGTPDGAPPPTPGPGLSGCAAALLALLGIILVLPGLCSLVSIFALIGESNFHLAFVLLWLVTFALAAGGIMLIRYALRMERDARAARDNQKRAASGPGEQP